MTGRNRQGPRRRVAAGLGALALLGGLAIAGVRPGLAASNAIPPDTDRQAEQRMDIRAALTTDQVNDLRASCAEGTVKAPGARDLPIGEQCLEALTRSVGEGYARDYYDWEYRAIAKAGGQAAEPTRDQVDGLTRQIDAAAGQGHKTAAIQVGDKVIDFPVLRSRAFDAGYVQALRDSGRSKLAKVAMSDAVLRRTVQSCYANQADVSVIQCRGAARELARRALLRTGAQ